MRAAVCTSILAAWLGTAPQEAPSGPPPMSEDQKIVHVLNRLTPGATPELVAEVRSAGLAAWLDRQLKGDLPETAALTDRLTDFETLALSLKEIAEKYSDRIPKDATPQQKREIRQRAAIPTRETLSWVGLRAVYGSNVVRETMCDFFRNHFAVSIEKGEVRFLVAGWERDVIHKHSLGKFGDLLTATARHPAMLFYLDNFLSRRPATTQELRDLESRIKRRTGSEERAEEAVDLAKQRGLNENYARELLELHTLGVDNGYTQDDVINVAKCLTGWTIRRPADGEVGFRFDRFQHCPGDKTFLGAVIKENKADPVREGEEVLARLTKSPGTARFLSWKLCRWLVRDDPPETMVQRVAKVFEQTEGDLPKVVRAIVDDPEFFSPANFRAKFKRPWEYIVSALRVTHAEEERAKIHAVNSYLESMNEPLYRCADPTGYYDQAEAWRDPGAMATRWTFANDLASGRMGGVRIPSSFYSDLPRGKPDEWKEILVRKILPVAGIGRLTSANIDRLVGEHLKRDPKAGPTQVGPVIVAVLLGSPEFQKQ